MRDSDVNRLLQQVRDGNQMAAMELFHRYSEQLVELAQERLNWKLRRKLDPEDIAQSALRSFFRMNAAKRFDFENWNSLWGLLSLLTIRKCGRQLEHFRAACRDIGTEMSAFWKPDGDNSSASWEAIARDPSPEEAAVLSETVREILSLLDEREQAIFQLSLQGHTVEEISETIGRSERTVERVLSRLSQLLTDRCGESNVDE